ncbi:hypothetical protein RclHR1_09280004 [Rhizophagus clarus]|uniref:Protein kinase domain-containing protein n=1 Tax=Rhizophagus clarus TaxID=94130 RepID=A0A2Z6S9X9_9GLOM|nr:hypothetical protein RclHR1_09280004 [Rhizophagus clarus]
MHVNTRNLNNNPKFKKVYQEIILEEKIKNYSEMNSSCKNINFYDILRVVKAILSSHGEEIIHRDLHSKNMVVNIGIAHSAYYTIMGNI